jgi:hypothetical protein
MQNNTMEKTFEEKSQSKEWGAWKFVSDMLDNPNENGLYQTSKCYEQIHDFVVEQTHLAEQSLVQRIREDIKETRRQESVKISTGPVIIKPAVSYNLAIDKILNLPSLSTPKPKGDK